MSVDLTAVIRGYGSTNIRPAQLGAQQPPIAVDPDSFAALKWGKSGNSIFTEEAAHYGGEIIKSEDKKEVKRTFDVVRVSKADDPSTYIDTEVMTAWQARGAIDPSRTSISPSRTTFTFAKTKTADNVKVLSSGNTRVSGST